MSLWVYAFVNNPFAGVLVRFGEGMNLDVCVQFTTFTRKSGHLLLLFKERTFQFLTVTRPQISGIGCVCWQRKWLLSLSGWLIGCCSRPSISPCPDGTPVNHTPSTCRPSSSSLHHSFHLDALDPCQDIFNPPRKQQKQTKNPLST